MCRVPESKVLFTLLCIFVVMLRISGAHLHLCFDGGEAPAAMHITDDEGLHHANDKTHSDLDVSAVGDALVKHLDSGFNLPLLIATFFIVFCVRNPVLQISRTRINYLLPVAAHRAHLRPLLRGPPL